MDEDDEDRWELDSEDRDRLTRLDSKLWQLTGLARSGGDLVALGEALNAIECLLRGDPIEINVGLMIGFRRGDADFEEGLFACFRINEEEVELWELNTTYSKDIGSDRSSRVFTVLRPQESFDAAGFEDWLDLLNEILKDDDAKLSTERDHI